MMRRWALWFVLLVLMVIPAGMAAQGTPGTDSVGQPVTVYSGQGVEAAQIAVTQVTDPFEDWDQYFAPRAGERYIMVVVEITNTGERPFQFEPFGFQLLDSVGRLYSGGFAPRSPASIAQVPDLEGASMLPGETVTGALMYTIPADAVVSQIIHLATMDDAPTYSYQHLFVLADLTP